MIFMLGSGEYVPERVVDNGYFAALTGKSPEWFTQRTGISQRRRAQPNEDLNSMALAAVQSLANRSPAALEGVDLIVGASYTPVDTIGTLAHVIQRRFDLRNSKALYLSTACSSFVDALELAAAYCETGRATKALIVAAEHNSAHARDEDITSGHLWGDGAAAVTVGINSARAEFKVIDVTTRGLAHEGHGPDAISLSTRTRALTMPHGREVFERACEQMANAVRVLLAANDLSLDDVALVVPHQANKRIIDHVARQLGLPPERMGLTIGSLGNTGCASVAITLHRYTSRVRPGAHVVLVTFGGGYSVGAALLRRMGEHA